jgi:hypothetical protein
VLVEVGSDFCDLIYRLDCFFTFTAGSGAFRAQNADDSVHLSPTEKKIATSLRTWAFARARFAKLEKLL